MSDETTPIGCKYRYNGDWGGKLEKTGSDVAQRSEITISQSDMALAVVRRTATRGPTCGTGVLSGVL